MAKALIGHVATDLQTTAAVRLDNLRLRSRVDDLESLVVRLQAENDLLAAGLREKSRRRRDQMQPA